MKSFAKCFIASLGLVAAVCHYGGLQAGSTDDEQYQKALQLISNKKWDDAEKILLSIVERKPQAYGDLIKVAVDQNEIEKAFEYSKQAAKRGYIELFSVKGELGFDSEYVNARRLVAEGKFDEAESILSQMAEKTPKMYRDLVLLLIEREQYQKALDYSLKGIERGVTTLYADAGWLYYQLEDYSKAKEFCLKAEEFTSKDQRVLFCLAEIYIKGLTGNKDGRMAESYYKKAIETGNIAAEYALSEHYALGDAEGIPKNIKKAQAFSLNIIKKMEDNTLLYDLKDPNFKEMYSILCNRVGYFYLRGDHNDTKKPDIINAGKYFQKAKDAGDVNGKANIAKLVWTRKIEGNRQEARNDIAECARAENKLAMMLQSLISIAEDGIVLGDQDTLTLKPDRSYIHPIGLLQIAIAQYYGVAGVPQNRDRAKLIFDTILGCKDNTLRSRYLAKGYMYIMGLGVAKDLKKGLRLVEESESKIDDVYLDTYELFPALKAVKEEVRKQIANELIEEYAREVAHKQAKQKGKQVSAPKNKEKSQSSASIARNVAGEACQDVSRKETIFDITPEKWNKTWEVTDNSRVSSVNKDRKEIRITYGDSSDQNKKEELVVKIQDNPYRTFRQIKFLYKDPRIEERKKSGNSQEIRNHNFAQMLDYVIQGAAVSVPWIKDGSVDVKDMLFTEVKRVNLLTNESVDCTAEYTFYEKNEKQYLYHCLLRPIKPKQVEGEDIYENA